MFQSLFLRYLVVVERLASSMDPPGYGVRGLVPLVGSSMTYRSEARNPTNSDPVSTAEKAESLRLRWLCLFAKRPAKPGFRRVNATGGFW